ncbi:MAG: phosphoribosyltransferase domain-containing protein [Agitococcus sp.]|nr:phosphoribosyltransferase domain-containing protein [Agitococcus sp.]
MQKSIVWFNKSLSSITHIVAGVVAADVANCLSIIVTHPEKDLQAELPDASFYREPLLSGAEYLAWALAFCTHHKVDVFFCGKQAGYLADFVAEFKQIGTQLLVAVSSTNCRILDDKDQAYRAMRDGGLAEIVPAYEVCATKEEFNRALDTLLPHGRLCFKPTVSIFGIGFRVISDTSVKTGLDRLLTGDVTYLSKRELNVLMTEMPTFKPIMVMPYLDGNERSIDCLAHAGQLVACVIRRKTGHGQVLENNPALIQWVSKLVALFGLDNCFNAQFREKDGQYYLLEINPRLSGGAHYTFHSGLTLPHLGIMLKLGMDVPFLVENKTNVRVLVTEGSRAVPATPSHGALAPCTHRIQGGDLQVTPRYVHPEYTLDSLTSFATRRNPKRAFLFTSKLTGKHIPARPSTLLKAYEDLARLLALRHPNVMVVGMAETAIGLAHGVFEALLRQGFKGGFLHSTRYRLDAPQLFGFEEQHCHASEHLLFTPLNSSALNAARTLVVIDDEISTGNTLVNVLTEYRKHYSQVTEIVLASLTSFISAERKKEVAALFPDISVRFVSLFEGDFTFTPNPAWVPEAMPALNGNNAIKNSLLVHNHGRQGVTELLDIKVGFLDRVKGRILVLGTGEFLYPALLLAARLEAEGNECYFQSTTRSPVALGDSIKHAYTFQDNYDDGIANFVYNVGGEQYDYILVCYETATFGTHELPFAHKKVYFKGQEAILV